jgi:hypothetical protein
LGGEAVDIRLYLASLPLATRSLVLTSLLRTVPEEERIAARRLLMIPRRGQVRGDLASTAKLVVWEVPCVVRVPLFEFSAPGIEGCVTTLERTTRKATAKEWSFTVGGTGGGKVPSFQTSLKSSFSAAAGERKRVFLPVAALAKRYFEPSVRSPVVLPHVPPRRVRRSRPNRPALAAGANRPDLSFRPRRPFPRLIPKGYRLEVSKPAHEPFPGIESLASRFEGTPAAFDQILNRLSLPGGRTRPRHPPDQRLNTFHLAGDRSGAAAVFEYEYEQSAAVTAKTGITAIGLKMTALVSVRLFETLKLSCRLIAGHDYELMGMGGGLGVRWLVDRKRW